MYYIITQREDSLQRSMYWNTLNLRKAEGVNHAAHDTRLLRNGTS
jgi:hypothetical protein